MNILTWRNLATFNLIMTDISTCTGNSELILGSYIFCSDDVSRALHLPRMPLQTNNPSLISRNHPTELRAFFKIIDQ